jgi:hypothetical protein
MRRNHWSRALPSPTTDPETDPDFQHSLQRRQHFRQLTLQCAAAFAVLSLAWPYFGIRNEALPWPATAFAIGGTALLLASLTRQPWWWRLIHAIFAPLAWGVAALNIDPGWFLMAFILMLLVYRGAVTGQIPLYLSNSVAAAALAKLIPETAGLRFIDLGAGVGSVLRPLARARPETQFTGIENAPATWLIGYLRTAGLTNCNWRWGDLWRVDLAPYDVVYAFLSPAPMSELWAKAQREMVSGSLVISNSFPVPGLDASAIIDLDDGRQTRLYCYRLGQQTVKA